MRKWTTRAAVAAVMGILAAAPAPGAAAEGETAPRRLLAAHEQAAWKGVGRLNTGVDGRDGVARGFDGYCTATLIGEKLALTAAHCLFEENGRRRLDTEMFFAAGWRNGRFQSIRQVRRSATHPGYHPNGPQATLKEIAVDIALLELDAPVLASEIPSYRTAGMPKVGEAVALVSYGRGRDQVLSLQDPCRVVERMESVSWLSCEVAPGSSGSPVFSHAGGQPEVVAVISAYRGDRSGSYAVVLEMAMPALLDALAARGPGRKITTSGGGLPQLGGAVGKSGGALNTGGAWAPVKPPKN